MKTVVFIIKSMAVSGGAEKVLATIAGNISSHQVILITFDKSIEQFFFKINNSVKVILFNSGLNLYSRFFDYFSCIKYLISLKADIVIVFNASCYIPLSFFSKLYTSKFIASEHSTFRFFEKSIFRRTILYLSHFFIYRYTMLSESVKLTFPGYIQSKSLIFENPILYKKEIKNIRIKNYLNILNIGRLSEEKNQITLIDAIALIFPNISQSIRVSIYGDGPLKSELTSRINHHGLNSVITIHKPIPDLSYVFSQADLFVMPSHYEGYGLAAAEALACGIPVVGYEECIGLRTFVIDGYNGVLISSTSRDCKALAKVIVRLLSDRNHLAMLASNSNLDGNLSLSSIMSKWEELIES